MRANPFLGKGAPEVHLLNATNKCVLSVIIPSFDLITPNYFSSYSVEHMWANGS